MRFPSTLELIAGKFLRHSKEFYEWRAKDREERIKADPSNLALYDDLAVAYSKTGRYELAIATMEKKEAIQPGLYETYSNLGTFHILAGEFEKGLPYIDKALSINPDAHFGREKYQKWLVEYALTKKKDGKLVFPMQGAYLGKGFSGYIAEKSNKEHLAIEDAQAAIKGVLGMMRFANHDNPLLLEALGDLLMVERHWHTNVDAKRMATRAYLQASYAMTDPTSKAGYRELASQAVQMQTRTPNNESQLPLEELEADFKKELAEANEWYAGVKAKEIEWIRDGKNPETEFNATYVTEPEFPPDTTPPFVAPWQKNLEVMLLGAGGALLLAVVGIVAVLRMRRRGGTRLMLNEVEAPPT